ncbi:MAG: UvrD-helicase domain-containing protein [Treponema sp.]|jgi:ATP-dependent helicase/nuclease subunit A|nr:UvrD-helicase domain-containing protein [Treponema sp.]
MSDKSNRPELNNEQKAAAFCAENAVVAAGAGSGKTMVLANRFAWLLTEKGYNVDEILTLTFTKKAAAQMFSRIHSLLSEISEKETGVKSERARRALDDFFHARIQTLDSYSTALVKQCAPRYGISPDFIIDQERCYELALEESLPYLITHRHHPAVEMLYSTKRPSDIVRKIFADVLFNYCLIDRPRDFNADARTQFNVICAEWKKQCEEIAVILQEIGNVISYDKELFPDIIPVMYKFKRKNINIPKYSVIQEYFNYLMSLPPESCIEKAEAHPIQKDIVSLLYFLAEIYSLNLSKGKRPAAGNPIKENIRQIRALFGKFSSLAVSCMQAGFIVSIMSLLPELQNRYLNSKRAEGVLTFADVASLSRTILLEQEDIRQSEKESYKAIMIDEFQDNNELQKDLLFLLAEKPEVTNKLIPKAEDLCPGKLFFVGDEKQSIYLFRGADVSVFRKLKDEIKSADLPLRINYRSAPALIGAFNAVFGGGNFDSEGKTPLSVMPSVFAPGVSTGGTLPLYEASYSPLETGKKIEGKFSLYILNKQDDSSDNAVSADENEARFTAEKIQGLLSEKTKIGGQKYQPKDIAVLFRSRSPQYLYEKHLRLLGIPYICEDVNDFFYGGIVNDIMSVLRLAAHPLDSAAYAEMLRSPFAGLSLPGAALCMAIFKGAENPAPFSDEPLPHLDEADRDKYLHGQKIYSHICGMAANENISSLVSELWYNEGCRYETEWNAATSVYKEFFDYLFHLAVKADAANEGLASFADSMRAFRDSGGRLSDIEIPLERPGAVRLLTIHKSKGLEFPVVFICCCGKHSQADRSEEVFFSGEAGIVFSPPLPQVCYSIQNMRNNFFWEQSSAESKLKRTAELRRLLYVGMTRAEKELYLTGSLDIRNAIETDDFSLIIKNYTEKKCENNENPITGDSILNNDTFFGLLLPSIASHIPQDGLKKSPSFFSLDAIPVYTDEYIKSLETTSADFSNDQRGLNGYLKQIEPFYLKAEKIQTPDLQDNHITPVSLRNKEEDTEPSDNFWGRSDIIIDKDFSGEKSDDVFGKVDHMLVRFAQTGDEYTEKFNSGSFGTIAHICVEACLNGKEAVIPSNIAGFLTPSETDALLAAGRELANRFVRSPMGKVAGSAKLRESEFSFRSLIRNKKGRDIFINGTVDLFFDDADSVHVVDFKTDSHEIPAEHTAQMACYHQAVSTLYALPIKKECRAWLYYLRTGHAIEMTQRIKQFNLTHRAFL